MKSIPDDILDLFVAAAHDVAARGLVKCSCGNLSLRLDAEHFLITGTGSWMSRLQRHEVVLCRLCDGSAVDDKRPSSEVGFHAGVLRARPDINAVLHFQSPYATALACTRDDTVDFAVIPEIPYYIGAVARVPYYRPGSEALAEAVTHALRHHDMALMANHGQVTAGRGLSQVIQNAEFFELACQILFVGGDAVHPMSSGDVEQLRQLRHKPLARV